MTNNMRKDYSFAMGIKIKQIFIESELYLDGNYSEHNAFENLSIRRIDTPLFLLLENDVLLRLYGTSLSIADDYDKEYVFGDKFVLNIKSQKEFNRLYGLTIVDVEEIYMNKYDLADDDGHIPSYFEEFQNSDKQNDKLIDLAIVFNNGLRLVCCMFLDFFDIEIVENP